MLLNLLDEGGVLRKHEVNGSTLATKTAGTTNSMDVVLFLEGKLVVDNETNLLNINTTSEEISGDEDTDGTGTELLHDDVTTELVHLTVHDGDGEIVLSHGLLELFNTLLGVAVDEGLVDIKVGVEVKKDVHLPLVLFDSDVVLLDTFKGELLVLNQNLCGVAHEVSGH